MDKKFIVTTSEDTANRLQQIGFKLIQHYGNQWTFLNDSKLTFSNIKNVSFSNTIFM